MLYPNPSDPLNGEAAALHMRDPGAYQKKVRDYVARYARPEDVAALEQGAKHGGGSGSGGGEGMSEDGGSGAAGVALVCMCVGVGGGGVAFAEPASSHLLARLLACRRLPV